MKPHSLSIQIFTLIRATGHGKPTAELQRAVTELTFFDMLQDIGIPITHVIITTL